MTPQKAIIIVLTLSLMMAVGFVFLYSNKQKAIIQNNLKLGESAAESTAPKAVSFKAAAEIERQLEETVEEAKKNPTPANQAAARQAVIETLDAIETDQTEIKDNRTLEQKSAEMNALLDQISSRNN